MVQVYFAGKAESEDVIQSFLFYAIYKMFRTRHNSAFSSNDERREVKELNLFV